MAQAMVEMGRTGLEAADVPRMHVEAAEPVQVTRSVGEPVIEELEAMGHQLSVQRGIAGGAHIAEVLKREGKLRGSGNGWAAAPDNA